MAALTVEVWTLCDCFSWSSSWGICFIFLLSLSSHSHKPPFSSFYIFCSVLLHFKSVPAMCRLCILLYLLLLRHREALHLPALHSHPWTILCSLCSFCLSYSVSFISQELEDSESCCLWSICSDSPLHSVEGSISKHENISEFRKYVKTTAFCMCLKCRMSKPDTCSCFPHFSPLLCSGLS